MSLEKYRPVLDTTGKLVRLSVSQLSRFDHKSHGGCQRKWWFKYIGKIPDPPEAPDDPKLVGKQAHKRLEDYFVGKEVPGGRVHDTSQLSPMELPALRELPPPGPDVFPEVDLDHLRLGGLEFQGAMDLLDINTYTVYDYKFQSSPRAFKEPTVQMWGYLEEMRIRFDLKTIPLKFRFIGVDKNPPHKAKVSPFDKSCQEVADAWGSYEPMVKEMQAVSQCSTQYEVPFNDKACYAFGVKYSCPYLGICDKADKESEKVIVSFLDDLKEAKSTIPYVNGVLPEDNKVMPPDVSPQPTPITEDPREVPDSSPAHSPKADKKTKAKAASRVVTFRYVKKVNLERVLGPAFKYENREFELSVQEEGASEAEVMEAVTKAVDAFADSVIAKEKK